MFNKAKINLKDYKTRKDKFEIVSAAGKLQNTPRKIVVTGAFNESKRY